MMIQEDMIVLGFKDMHEDQQEALMNLIQMALIAASATGDEELITETAEAADSCVRLFGGQGVFRVSV